MLFNTKVTIELAKNITTIQIRAFIITFFQFFSFSSSQAAVMILKPNHNQYITAIIYKNVMTLEMIF
jgi:hypothetical protein